MPYAGWAGRKFGVEIELTNQTVSGQVLSEQQIKNALRGALPTGRVNTRAAGYYHSTGDQWDVKTDSSCGWEVASPALMLTEAGECEELKKGVMAIKSLNPLVDRRCSVHVHIEVRDYDWRDMKALLALWVRYEPYFFEMMPASRRANIYCLPTRASVWDRDNATNWPRFQTLLSQTTNAGFRRQGQSISHRGALNLTHFWQAGRVEIRLHSGTCDYNKIRMWVALMLAMVNRVKQADMSLVVAGNYGRKGFKAEYIGKVLGLLPSAQKLDVHPHGAEVVRWMERRHQYFTPTPTVVTPEVRVAAAQVAADAGDWQAAVDAALGRAR